MWGFRGNSHFLRFQHAMTRRGWNLVDPCHVHPTFSQERMGIWLENVGNSTHLLDSNVRLVAIELPKQIQVVTTCKTASGDGK